MPDGQFYGAIIWYHLIAPFYGMCVPGISWVVTSVVVLLLRFEIVTFKCSETVLHSSPSLCAVSILN